MTANDKYDYQKILLKVAGFCAYQERCISDVKRKLNSLGVTGDDALKMIEQLKKERFIDEKRYAAFFVSGKFKNNGWGRIKIENALRAKGIDEKDIREAMYFIPEEAYLTKLKLLITKKSRELKEDNFAKRKQKLVNFALGRGYESELVWKVIGEVEL